MASKAELYELAGELGVANRDSLTKAQLAAAVEKAKADGNSSEKPTPQQKSSASNKESPELVTDAMSENKQVANAAKGELESRQAKVKAQIESNSRRRQLPQQYVVTKPCVLARNGILTDLAKGSIVSSATHDLDEIKKAGAEIEECSGRVMTTDQFGRFILKAK